MADQPNNAIVNAPEAGNPAEVDAPVSDVPEHLQGKSPQELVDMYRNLESKLGEQSNELGQLRQFANAQIAAQEQQKAPEEDVDFYADPEKYMQRAIDARLEPYNQVLRAQQQQAVKQRLDAEFPQWQETAKSEEFINWVKASKVRRDLFVQADASDYHAAAELFGTWNELGKTRSETQKAERKAVDRDRKLRAVKTEKGAGRIDPRKILYAADLRELKQTNPNRYQELLPDIKRAYAEGRVRR